MEGEKVKMFRFSNNENDVTVMVTVTASLEVGVVIGDWFKWHG